MPISVGIDFGTARSGYSFTTGDGAVQVRQRWPGKSVCYCKTLSALLYQRRGRRYEVAAWGWEALERYKQLKEAELDSWAYASQFKLLLAEQNEYSNVPAMVLPPGKSALDVIADFLRCLKQAALDEIDLALQRPDHATLQWVLTVPAGWAPAALQTMREAAVAAGIITSERDERLTFVFEPEAAAISTLNNQTTLGLSVGNTLVVVDAGGGTIDITAHKVCSKGGRWALEEASVRRGLLKGAVFLDARFEDHLCGLLGRSAYQAWAARFPQEHLRLIHNKWEEQKMSFTGDNPAIIELAWSKSMTRLFEEAGLPVEAEEGELKLTDSAMRTLFDAVLGDVITEVSSFVNGLPTGCNHVVLVGGFGESSYFLKQLQSALSTRGCKVVSPMVPSQAVLTGAALYGQNQATVASRRMAYAYGVECSTAWTPSHRADLKFFHTEKQKHYVDKVFAKLISVNKTVTHDQVISRAFWASYKHQESVSFKIFITQDNKAKYTDEPSMRLLGEVVLKIANPKRVTNPDKYKLRVDFRFGTTELKVTATDVQTKRAVAVNMRFASSASPVIKG